jgi:hypothetical protein
VEPILCAWKCDRVLGYMLHHSRRLLACIVTMSAADLSSSLGRKTDLRPFGDHSISRPVARRRFQRSTTPRSATCAGTRYAYLLDRTVGSPLKTHDPHPISGADRTVRSKKRIMRITNIALLAGLTIAASATPALAAVRESGATNSRDAAIAACTAQARQRFGGTYYNFDQNRAFVYGDCMEQHRQPR